MFCLIFGKYKSLLFPQCANSFSWVGSVLSFSVNTLSRGQLASPKWTSIVEFNFSGECLDKRFALHRQCETSP